MHFRLSFLLFGSICCYVSADRVPFFSNDNKQLYLVVESSSNVRDLIKQLSDNLPQIVQQMTAKHPNWISAYVIYSFDPNTLIRSTKRVTSIEDAQKELQNVYTQATNAPVTCSRPIVSILKNVFSLWKPDYDEVLVITSGMPSAASYEEAINATENWGLRPPRIDLINVVDVMDSCRYSDNTSGLDDYISSSNGVYMRSYMRSNSYNALKAITTLLPTRYSPQVRFSAHLDNCLTDFSGTQFAVTTDTDMHDFYSVLYGDFKKYGFDGPSNRWYHTFADGIQNMWRLSIRPEEASTYNFTLVSVGLTCRFFTYGDGGVEVFTGFVRDLKNNAEPASIQLWEKESNFVVFKFIGGQGSFTDATVTIQDETKSVSTKYDVVKINDELYGIVTPINCGYSERIFVVVNGFDSKGTRFERRFNTWCIHKPIY